MSSVVIGKDTGTGQEINIDDIERRSGLYILGKPGMGKSTLIVNLMTQDIEHGHGLFFLDPHGEAISDLIHRIDRETTDMDTLRESVLLLDPEHETHSFGINLLSCRDITSLREREASYKRAYNVFEKLWEDSWGIWLQLIIENTLPVFIQNPDYTLAEVPRFLMDQEFRTYLLQNMKYELEIADFWKYEFEERRTQDKEEIVQPALTRVRSLLNRRYVRDIIGQKTTTINFAELMEKQVIIFVRLSANLPSDVKKFIGTILISELVHTVRNRPESNREQFCIFVDEFQNFASSEEFGTLITEARKFGVATTIAHQERFGQFANNLKLLGATAAAANKVLFQLTVKDAQELAPEFAEKADDTKTRLGGELVNSPRVIEEIWERGHPDEKIMHLREKYFWIVDLLKSKPQESYYIFDPTTAKNAEGNDRRLDYEKFTDWEGYRSSREMLRLGISLLNKYYYKCMQMVLKRELLAMKNCKCF